MVLESRHRLDANFTSFSLSVFWLVFVQEFEFKEHDWTSLRCNEQQEYSSREHTRRKCYECMREMTAVISSNKSLALTKKEAHIMRMVCDTDSIINIYGIVTDEPGFVVDRLTGMYECLKDALPPSSLSLSLIIFLIEKVNNVNREKRLWLSIPWLSLDRNSTFALDLAKQLGQ